MISIEKNNVAEFMDKINNDSGFVDIMFITESIKFTFMVLIEKIVCRGKYIEIQTDQSGFSNNIMIGVDDISKCEYSDIGIVNIQTLNDEKIIFNFS